MEDLVDQVDVGDDSRVDSGALEAASRPRAVASSLYAAGTFPRSAPAAPPIYKVPGGGRRPQNVIDIDIRLRAAVSSAELLRIIADSLPRFDIGNAVIAFACAAKLDNGKEMATLEPSPAWSALQERLLICAEELEPRGMSMTAYSAARLMWGDEVLLASLARAGVRRSFDFGATDIAKACWAFAKLRHVDEPTAASFWSSMSREAPRVVRSARFVDVSMIGWAFALSDKGNNDLFAEISSATRITCDTLAPRSLASISWSCARASYKDRRLFAALAERASLVVDEFTGHDISAFCWAFTAAGETNKHVFNALAAHLLSAGLLARLSPSLAAELAAAFAGAGVFHAALFEELEKQCVEHIADLETEDVAGFAWAFATAGWQKSSTCDAVSTYAARLLDRKSQQLACWGMVPTKCGTVHGGNG